MSTDEKPQAPNQERKEALPESAVLVPCPQCHTICPVVLLETGEQIMVQPTFIRGVIVADELVQSIRPPDAQELMLKLVGRTARGKMSPPVMIPHFLVCSPSPLLRGLAPAPEPEDRTN